MALNTPQVGQSPQPTTSERLRDAFRAKVPGDLLDTQATAIGLILKRFADIADRALKSLAGTAPEGVPSTPNGEPDITRPHHVFCIDGGRGAGKTYTLLSLAHVLNVIAKLRQYHAIGAQDVTEDEALWRAFVKEQIGGNLDKFLTSGTTRIGLVQPLRIIFPGDMEGRESPMEAIFAAIMGNLTEQEEQLSGGSESQIPARTRQPDRLKAVKALIKELRGDVAQGWYFSRSFGHEAIVRDSIDYREFVQRFEEETRKSAKRIDAWRMFVNKYLDFSNVATLAIVLDDSDVRPALTHDILHSIRMFFNHPRIITVLAGNLRAMRTSLLYQAMSDLGNSMKALEQRENSTARDWRRIERKALEDYLEKILPTSQRFFLKRPSAGANLGSSGDQRKSDFEKITHKGLLDFCDGMLTANRGPFLSEKFHLGNFRAAARPPRSDRPQSAAQFKQLEDYISWWLFTHRYRAILAPRSARQIVTFSDYYSEFLPVDSSLVTAAPSQLSRVRPVHHQKRLIITLFENPANYTLIHRLGDEDGNVTRWLQQQQLSSTWVGKRVFRINGREVNHGTYTYDYVCYRLDIGLAMPVRHNPEESAPPTLLPRLVGRKHMRRFFQPQTMPRRHRRVGVAFWMDHAAVPGNCVYFFDLQALPDRSLRPEEVTGNTWSKGDEDDGIWESSLPNKWFDLIDDEQDEYVYRYFTDVVCCSQTGTEAVPSADLIRLLDPPRTPADDDDILYGTFWKSEYHLLKSPFKNLWDENNEQRQRMVALYAAMITDLRRAWHAIRIYENSPLQTDTAYPQSIGHVSGAATLSEEEQASLAIIARQGRMQLYTREYIRDLFLRSPWSKKLLAVFSVENVTACLRSLDADVSIAPQAWTGWKERTEAEIRKLYEPDQSAYNSDEREAYKTWTQTLRTFGRISCEGWPVYGEPNSKDRKPVSWQHVKFFEEKLFDGANCFRLVGRYATDQPSGDEQRIRQQENGRAARNFVLLLYGLAPSLPAIIHSNIMAKVYAARLGKGIDRERQPDNKTIREGQIAEIDKWAGLVGALTVALRYIRVSYLFLHMRLAIEAMLLPPHGTSAVQDKTKLKKSAKEFLDVCGCKHSTGLFDEERALEAVKELRDIFIGDNENENFHRLSKSLAIMPDVASSTLFGEHWLRDTVRRLVNGGHARLKEITEVSKDEPTDGNSAFESDDPMAVAGVFPETEQWLWATNRCLWKMAFELKTARNSR